jgi:hypothetical protein
MPVHFKRLIAALIAAGLLAVPYGTYRLGKRIGSRDGQALAAREFSQAPAKLPDVDPSISTPEETRKAVAMVQAAGGLVLPKQFYVMGGSEVGIYLRDIVPVKDPEVFRYELSQTCAYARLERRRIALAPPATLRDTCHLTVEVLTVDRQPVTRSSLEVVVVPPDAPLSQQSFQVLMVGDSLGHQSRFPNELADMFQAPGNPKVEFIGTHRPAGSKISHEHYGGWRFIYFTTVIDVDPKNYYVTRSPFVFKGPDDGPVLDVARYLKESVGGAHPRNVHIQLGTNDAFALDPQDPDLRKKHLEIMAHADTLIAGIRKALPDAIITVGSVIQANAADRAFVESYRAYVQYHSEWRWRQGQMALAKIMIDYFEGRTNEHIFLVPTHMTVDPLDGYNSHVWVPEGVNYELSNAVHPSHVGDRQLATTVYAVIRAELAGLVGGH